MSEVTIIHNVRKCKCSDCKRVLLKGEGIQHSMPWFGGRNPYFYLCPTCDNKRKMDKEARAAGVDYE